MTVLRYQILQLKHPIEKRLAYSLTLFVICFILLFSCRAALNVTSSLAASTLTLIDVIVSNMLFLFACGHPIDFNIFDEGSRCFMIKILTESLGELCRRDPVTLAKIPFLFINKPLQTILDLSALSLNDSNFRVFALSFLLRSIEMVTFMIVDGHVGQFERIFLKVNRR